MSFSEILGQDLALTILQNALENQRLSHAYLFVGEEGIGKDITAFEFAKAINCNERGKNSCGECISCRKADNKNHPDIKEIEPDGASIKIDQIRKLQQEILYKPYESKKKVYIIHQADQMNPQAANSLLKTLEEPPSYAIIILVANNSHQLLPTIISRCQLIKFRRIADDLIKNKLVSDYELPSQKAQLITSLSAGRYKMALQLVEEEERLEEREEILELITSFKSLDRKKVFEIAQQLLDDRDKINSILDIILTWYRDLLLIKLDQTADLVNIDYMKELEAEAQGWSISIIEQIIKLIEETNNLIKKVNVNLQLTLEVMLLRLNRLRRQEYGRSSRSYV